MKRNLRKGFGLLPLGVKEITYAVWEIFESRRNFAEIFNQWHASNSKWTDVNRKSKKFEFELDVKDFRMVSQIQVKTWNIL